MGAGGIVALLGASLGYYAFHDLSAAGSQTGGKNAEAQVAAALPVTGPKYTVLATGETLEWSAEDNVVPVYRQAGPYTLEITRKDEDGFAAPLVKLSAGTQAVTVEGELAQPGFANKISVIANRTAAVPVIMLQSFSGGAHCCNHVQLAGFSMGKLKVVDLGQWDGDRIELPSDVSGDGVADFVMHDDRFLYAFASYADSYAPPRIFNVIGGKAVDVSRNPRFRHLYVDAMKRAGEQCRPGNGSAANGACPAFVAAASRIGLLDQAWRQMLGAYDAAVDWDLPTGCWVADDHGCPEGQTISYKSYPEALRAFLERSGYLPDGWIPPEDRGRRDESPEQVPDDRTA